MTNTAHTPTPVRNNPEESGGGPPRAIITQDGELALRAELERIRRELEVEMAQRLREARTFGAPADNDDYLQIQEEGIILAVRAARLDDLLERARVVADGSFDGRAVVGTIVEVKELESGEVREHELVGGHEAPRIGAASAASPIGRALIGREAGEVVEVELPKGRSHGLEIMRVRPA
jgi:transcription elongation factor GreA